MNALIVEDHPITVLGIEVTLRKTQKFEKIYNANCGVDAIKILSQYKIEFLVLDIHLPKTDAHGLVRKILDRYPELLILVYTASNEEVYGQKYLAAGVRGFLTKNSRDEDFAIAVNSILRGSIYVTNNLLQNVMQQPTKLSTSNPFTYLSNRELEVLGHLLKGKSLKEICTIMNLQPSTIATQKSRIFTKLNTNSMVEVFHLANQYGMFEN